MRFRRSLALLAALASLAVFSGCGVTLEGASDSGQAGPVERLATNPESERDTSLPPRPAGVVRIQGKAQGSLTAALLDAYGHNSASFDVKSSAEGEAFAAFCAGRADVVDSARPISADEYAACRENGIQPVQLQVASDAVVLAIENETDVGVDCLSLADVREIFRAGSPISNWSQVGYGSRPADSANTLPVKVAGPDENANAFGFFGRFVLGDPDPSALTMRSDYQAFPTDRGVRLAVTGTPRERLQEEQLAGEKRSLVGLSGAVSDAERAVAEAAHQVVKGQRDERSEAEQESDSRQLAAAEAKLAKLRSEQRAARREVRADAAAAGAVADREGTLGLFRFSYYELWEERLRPMEIEASGDEGKPECIFPSQATITNLVYPLSRQLLLTVDQATMREAEIERFLAFAVENSGRLAVAKALVPLPDEVRRTELAWLQGEAAPDVVYYAPWQIARESGSGG